MKGLGKTNCKGDKCKHVSTQVSGFCGWCHKKYLKGLLLPDGRVKSEVCKANNCDYPSKVRGWCGWCVKKFERGELLGDGSLSISASVAAAQKKIRSEKRAKNKVKKGNQDLKDEIRSKLTMDKLKALSREHKEYQITFGCPYHQIQIESAACFNRMFLKPKSKKRTGLGLCQKCDWHDTKLVTLKSRIEAT